MSDFDSRIDGLSAAKRALLEKRLREKLTKTSHSSVDDLDSHETKHVHRLPAALSDRLKIYSQQQEATLFMVLLAALQTLLYRYTKQANVFVGMPIAGRDRGELASLIGPFLDHSALCTSFEDSPSFSKVVSRVKQKTLEAYANQAVPFETVAEAVKPGQTYGPPIFQALMQLRSLPNAATTAYDLTACDLAVEPVKLVQEQARSELALDIVTTEDGLCCSFQYRTACFDEDTIARLAGDFEQLLQAAIAEPERSVDELPVLPVTEAKMKNAEIESFNVESAGNGAEERDATERSETENAEIEDGPLIFPCSFAQQRLWFINQLEGPSTTYNIRQIKRLSGPLQVDALARAISLIVERHEILRTTFKVVDNQPKQVVSEVGFFNDSLSEDGIPESSSIQLSVVDLREVPSPLRDQRCQDLLAKELNFCFDLTTGPLFRPTLIRLTEQESVFVLNMHHIISDGWSLGVLSKEINALYAAAAQEEDEEDTVSVASVLSALEIQYGDYTDWQRDWLQGEVLEKQVTYWREQLAGIPSVIALPTDFPRPSISSYKGKKYGITISADLSASLRKLGEDNNTTLFMTLLSCLSALLYRYTEQEDIVIGTPIAARDQSEIEGLIGLFANTLALRTTFRSTLDFLDLLQQVRQVALEAYDHQALPFEKLVEELNPDRDLSYHPLFQVMFTLKSPDLEGLALPNVTSEKIFPERTFSKFDLSLALSESENGIVGVWEYSTDLFKENTIARLSEHFLTLLEGLVAHPQQPIATLSLLTEPEKKQLQAWSGQVIPSSKVLYPRDSTVNALFEAQASHTPDSVAVIFEKQQITYRDLDRRANQLANYLQSI
ncbi:MAG: condensation domain-containing protein, partial [Cyanobacteria bacterium J06632_3]